MISVIVITRNESKRIARCLSSVKWADEIIVLDSGSTDNTVEIAKRFTPHVHVNTDWRGYGLQKQRALAYAKGDWVLHIDADEWVTEGLKKVLLEVVKRNACDACRVPIRFCFYGKTLKHTQSPTRHARFFKRKGAKFSDDIVHEKILLPSDAKILQLKTALLHDSYLDVTHAIEKMNRYSSSSAKLRLKSKKPVSFLRCFFSAGWMFSRCYILQMGFLDGKAGLLVAVLNAEGSFYRGIKQIYQDAK